MKASSILAARYRHQGAMEEVYGSTVIIAGVEYRAAVLVGEVRSQSKDDQSGWEKVQDLTATVRKKRLAVAPDKKTVLVYGGIKYLIDDVGGQDEKAIAWVIKARRRMS